MSKSITIAVTGHRDLNPSHLAKLKKEVTNKLNTLREEYGHIILLSALAPGADILVAECIDLATDELIYIKALPENEEKTFSFNFDLTGNSDYTNEWEKRKTILSKNSKSEILFEEASYEKIKSLGDNSQFKSWVNSQYTQIGKYYAKKADCLIALWDGIDGGGQGGTSDVVHMYLTGKTNEGEQTERKAGKRSFYQLSTPRQKNSFPLGRWYGEYQQHFPFAKAFEWTHYHFIIHTNNIRSGLEKQIRKYTVALVSILLICMILCLADGYHFATHLDDFDWWPALSILILSIFFIIIYEIYNHVQKLFLEFILPLVIALYTLITGTIGFSIQGIRPVSDAFYAAANLLTLNTSVFHASFPDEMMGPVNLWLFNARITGSVFLVCAFLIALIFATGSENISRLHFWFWRRTGLLYKRNFKVVIGDCERAQLLSKDLLESNDKQRVVYLDTSKNPAQEVQWKHPKRWYMQGNAADPLSVKKTYFEEAEEVYILNEKDEDNFRIIQEIDTTYINSKSTKKKQAKWYVALENASQRAMLQDICRNKPTIYSIYENIARALMNQYPTDRFYYHIQNDIELCNTSHIAVIGFGAVAKAIVLNALRLGHFIKGNGSQYIHVYYQAEEKETVDLFMSEYGFLFKAETYEENYELNTYTFHTSRDSIIDFQPLPKEDSFMYDKNFSLYEYIRDSYITTIYCCLENSLDGPAFLHKVLPRISWLQAGNEGDQKNCDVQVFCYYQFPDKEEQEYVEMQLNALASHLPVICFGNNATACSSKAVKREEMDTLAKWIGWMYNNIHSIRRATQQKDVWVQLNALQFDDKTIFQRDEIWDKMPQMDKESNRNAADHAWVKFRETRQNWFNNKGYKDKNIFWSAQDINALIELEHRRWNAEKILAGWKPFDDKSVWNKHKPAIRAQKQHHFLCKFSDLPEEEQLKDFSQIASLPFFIEQVIKKGLDA